MHVRCKVSEASARELSACAYSMRTPTYALLTYGSTHQADSDFKDTFDECKTEFLAAAPTFA